MKTDPLGFPVAEGWPSIDARTMTEVDRLMIEAYRIALVQMMENAGRALARLAAAHLPGRDPCGALVVVLAGAGGNGGGALAAARRLASWGAEVSIVLAQDAAAMTPIPALQLDILCRMGVTPGPLPEAPAALILDGLIGYSLKGAPRGRAAALIDWANTRAAPTLALDVPSGFDATSCRVQAPAIQAAATLALALPKTGLAQTPAAGALYLADISVPPALYRRLPEPLEVPGFAAGDILRLRSVGDALLPPHSQAVEKSR